MRAEPGAAAHVATSALGPGSLAYRPDIDGLRALAILPVVLFHADIGLFRGGFVGVDIFFVISGYLITAIIHRDIAAGHFSFGHFYERRIRRIYPALICVSLVCTLAAAVLLIPRDFRQYGQSLVAMAFFVSNMFFRQDVGVTGYFHAVAEPPLLIHTWSLAVEEQFYIVVPPALLLLHRFAGRRAGGVLRATLGCAIVLSFALSVLLVATRPSDAFYLIASRAWELLVGSVLAIVALPPLSKAWMRHGTAGTGLALIAIAVFSYSAATPFPGVSAGPPCLGAWLILYAGQAGPSFVTDLLSRRPLVLVGRISYSLYLWHWPVIVITKYLSYGQLTLGKTLVALALSLAAAILSYRYVEMPFRQRDAVMTRRPLFAAAAAATILTVALGAFVVASDGLPQRFDPGVRTLIANNLARESDDTGDVACLNTERVIAALADIRTCPIGRAETRKILFWGDSHMEELRPVIQTLYDEGALGGRSAIFAIAQACPPSQIMDRSLRLHCDTFAKLAFERAQAADIDTVFIFSTGWWTSADYDLCRVETGACPALPKDEALAIFKDELAAEVLTLRRSNKRVFIGLSDPTYGLRIPHLEILKATLPRINLVKSLKRFDFVATREALAEVARATGAFVFDARASLCTGETCMIEQHGVSLYVDDNHIAKSQIGLFHDNLRDAIGRAALP